VSPEPTPKFVVKRLLTQQSKSGARDLLPKWLILRLYRMGWTLVRQRILTLLRIQ
jgi:hypothetical protein